MDYLITLLLTIIAALIIWRLKDWLSTKINPDIKFNKAPKNLLRHITPGVTIEKVREILGTPYYNDANKLTYKFNSLNLEVKKEDNKVETIILVLKKFGIRNKYPIHPTDYVLGSVTLGDVIDHPQEDFGVDISSKHGQVWIERYFGNPGHYWNYTFGILDGPGALYPDDFPDFDTEEQKIYGDYEYLKVNFVAVSNKSGQGHVFDFYAMR